MEVDLTNSVLFRSFAEFEQDGIYIDLHNEFVCEVIEYSSKDKRLKLLFASIDKLQNRISSVSVIFSECDIQFFSDKIESGSDSGTIDMIYRGRFKNETGELRESFDDGKFYYYINFLSDKSIELFAGSVKAKIDLN